MTNPQVNTFSPITIPEIQQFQNYLPTAFSDNLTLLQKVNGVIQSLTALGVPINTLIDQWNNQIIPYVTGDGLNQDVINQLTAWENDGTLDNIINQQVFGQINTDLTNIEGVTGKRIQDFPKQIPEVNDSARIQRGFDSLSDQDIFLFEYGKTYTMDNWVNISSQANPIGFHLVGYGVTIKTVVNGLTNIFDVQYGKGFTIKGFKFDQNLQGRTSINCNHCTNFTISECEFTGYTADYGWSTFDGGLCCSCCYDYTILNNFWHQHGNQYDATTATLNRCITIQGGAGTGDRCRIIGNNFYQVNQAIAINTGEDNIIMGNTFEEVHDNTLYSLAGVAGLVITGNTFNDKFDECLVIGGGDYVITGNKFRNTPNKFIAINDNVKSLIVEGNTMDNTGTSSGSFIAFRDVSHTITNLIVDNNVFIHPNLTDANLILFDLGNLMKFKFANNQFNTNALAYQRFLYFEGTTAIGVVKDNDFIGSNSTSKTIEVSATVTTEDIVYENNNHTNCRGVLGNIVTKGHSIQTSSGPYILDKFKNKVAYMASVPTLGVWSQGDIVYNMTPSASGFVGWVCTSGGNFATTAPVFKTFGAIGA